MAIKKPNYFSFPNEVVDEHLKSLSGAELRILLLLFRETKGWRRDTTVLSISRIMELTGLGKSSICEASRSLEEKTLIKRTTQTTTDGAFSSTRYEIDFEEVVVQCSGQGLSTVADKGSPEIGQGLSGEPDTYKEEKQYTEEQEETTTPTPSEKVSPERIGRGWQDQPGLPKLSRLQRTQLITGAKSVSLTEEEMQLSFRGYRNSPWAQERGFPVRAWLKNPLSWIDLAEPIPGLTVADELFGQYIEIFKKAGVPIGDKEREDALKLWAPLTEDQKIGSGRDAIRYCAGREARYIKPPAKHLTEKPWTRVVEERTLPMVAPTGPLDKNAEMRRLARAKGHEVTI